MTKEITTTKIALFKGKEIRKTIYKNEWWFVIVDVIKALTDSANPKQYLKNMLNRDEELIKGWVQIEHPRRKLPKAKTRKVFLRIKTRREKAEKFQAAREKNLKKNRGGRLLPKIIISVAEIK